MSITVLKGIYWFGFIFFLCSSAYSFWRTRKIVRDFRELSESARKVTALTTERDALRAAIQAEIDDSKQDTSRLEAALPAPAQV